MVKRFIAGALCPSCGAADALRVEHYTDDAGVAQMARDCVDCGFTDTLAADQPMTSAVPGTRIEPAHRDDYRQVVRIMPLTHPKA